VRLWWPRRSAFGEGLESFREAVEFDLARDRGKTKRLRGGGLAGRHVQKDEELPGNFGNCRFDEAEFEMSLSVIRHFLDFQATKLAIETIFGGARFGVGDQSK